MDRNRITKLAFLIVFTSFLLSTFISLWSLHMMTQNNMKEISRVLTARIYDTISSELSEPIIISKTMANDKFLINLLGTEKSLSEEEAVGTMREYLERLRRGLDYESVYVISEGSKRYYSYTGLNKVIDPENDSFDEWYPEFISTGKDYMLDVDSDEVAGNEWTVFVDSRIEDGGGRLLGVCGVGMNMKRSVGLFAALESRYNVKIDLVDRDGLVKIATDESHIAEDTYISGIRLGGIDGDEYSYQKLGGNRYAVTKHIDKLDWYLVVRSDGSNERTQFLNVILLNVILCLFAMALMVIAIRIIMLRTIALTNASFNDQATGLLNRRAFEEEKERLHSGQLDEDFVYVTVDVNGLKAVNDNLGHAAGDELIKGAADCLSECFGKYGSVYRIGGDEFAAMLRVSPDKLDELKAKLEKTVDAWKGDKVDKLSMSCGYAAAKEFPSENIAELIRISDERMYAAKEEHYRKTGAKRRK